MIRKKTGLILFLYGMVFVVLLVLTAYFCYTGFINRDTKLTIVSRSTEQRPQEKKEKPPVVKVTAVAQKIEKDEEITEGKLTMIETDKSTCPSNAVFVIQDVIGKKAAIPLESNTVITTSMLYSPSEGIKESDKLKDYELSGGMVGGMVVEGAYIDIEFINPKGETYIVLAKKLVKKKLDNNRIILQLSFDERKLINYALAEQKELGGRLDAVVYADNRQAEPKMDYPIPKLENKQNQTQSTVAPSNTVQSNNTPSLNAAQTNPNAPVTLDKPVKGGIN